MRARDFLWWFSTILEILKQQYKKYWLIFSQHFEVAGAGKSATMAWLVHCLSGLQDSEVVPEQPSSRPLDPNAETLNPRL